MSEVILSIGIIFFLAHIAVSVFERTKIPDVLSLILLGLIIGPLLGVVKISDFGKVGSVFSSIALVVILFESGTTLNLKTLSESIRSTISISISSFIASIVLVTVTVYFLLGLTLMPSIITGIILGGTSSAVVIPLVKALRMKEKSETILIIESALTDVLCIVLVFSLIQAEINGSIETGKIIGSILSSLLFALVIGLVGSIAWLLVLNTVRRFPNTILSTFAFVFIVYGISEFLGFSGAIASLSFGIGLTNHERIRAFLGIKILRQREFAVITETEKTFYKEIVFVIKTFFFLYLGISIKFGEIATGVTAALIVVFIYAARLLLTRFVVEKEVERRDASLISIMVPKGLAAAVLASIPLQQGMAGGQVIQDVVYLTVLTSIIATVILVPLIEKNTLNWFYGPIFGGFKPDTSVGEAPPANPHPDEYV